MNILVCVKRVADTGAKITLTPDEQEIETRNLGFTISPHEECAVEAAIRLTEQHGGATTVLTLGPEAAAEQLRASLAQGVEEAILLPANGRDWDPEATAQALATAVQTLQGQGTNFDLLLFGNEAADSGDYQVGIRVAYALDLPCVTGIKALELKDGLAVARREGPAGWERFEVALPAVFTVKEGINVPRYPTLRGRMRAKKKEIKQFTPEWRQPELQKVRLKTLKEADKQVEILGYGLEATPKLAAFLKQFIGASR